MENTKPVVLILSSERSCRSCLKIAVNLAAEEKRPLSALYVITIKEKEYVARRIKEMGFLGTEPAGDILDAVEKNDRFNAQILWKELSDLAHEKAVQLNAGIRNGGFYDTVKQYVAEQNPDFIVLTRARWKWLEKQWYGSVVDRFMEEFDADIIVVRDREQI